MVAWFFERSDLTVWLDVKHIMCVMSWSYMSSNVWYLFYVLRFKCLRFWKNEPHVGGWKPNTHYALPVFFLSIACRLTRLMPYLYSACLSQVDSLVLSQSHVLIRPCLAWLGWHWLVTRFWHQHQQSVHNLGVHTSHCWHGMAGTYT